MSNNAEFQPPIAEEPRMPGAESGMDDKPEWRPRYPGSGRLKGKRTIVTGADSGIGRAVAALFAREGADVAIVYFAEEEDEDAAKTKAIVEEEGRRALVLRGDLGRKEFAEEVVRRTVDAFGGIDVLVNNAGEQHPDENGRGHHRGTAAADVPDQHLLHVPSGSGGASAPETRQRDRELHQRDHV